MDFVLLNNASSATDSNGGPLLAPVLIRIAGALEVYLDRDVALVWGGSYRVRAGSSSADIQPGEVACAIVDSLPDAPGAVAYHDVSGAEVPVVFLAKSQCDSLISGPDSVSSALSHELVEASVDPFCNEWIQDASGRQWAKEAADPLQEWTYENRWRNCQRLRASELLGPRLGWTMELRSAPRWSGHLWAVRRRNGRLRHRADRWHRGDADHGGDPPAPHGAEAPPGLTHAPPRVAGEGGACVTLEEQKARGALLDALAVLAALKDHVDNGTDSAHESLLAAWTVARDKAGAAADAYVRASGGGQ